MKKPMVFIIVIVAVLALGGYLLLGKKTQTEIGPEVEVSKGGGTQSYTLKALKAAIEVGIPLKCSYKVGELEYTGYIKGKNWRGKMEVGEEKTTEIIIKNNCMYTWMEGEQMGIKMCFEEDIWEEEDYQQTAQDMEYYCVPSAVTDSQFDPPADIEFMDTFQGMEGMIQE